jgi:transposase InsO family protein
MKAMEGEHSIAVMSEVFGVSRSGYHAWRAGRPRARQAEDARIRQALCAAHQRSRGTYGRPRLQRELRALGMKHSGRRLRRLMKAAGLQGVQRGRFVPRTTDSEHDLGPAPNWLGKIPMPAAPGQVWVADITYVPTDEGWLYLAGVLDLCSRRVVGLAAAGHLETSLPENALRAAITRHGCAPGLLHHSDRGVQYASARYGALLGQHGITPSMSRRANCYDNAHMESFWGTLKAELVHRHRFATRHEAWLAILDYVETFYNRVRLHSALGYQSPVDFENNLN